jgi:hypothetical protein
MTTINIHQSAVAGVCCIVKMQTGERSTDTEGAQSTEHGHGHGARAQAQRGEDVLLLYFAVFQCHLMVDCFALPTTTNLAI